MGILLLAIWKNFQWDSSIILKRDVSIYYATSFSKMCSVDILLFIWTEISIYQETVGETEQNTVKCSAVKLFLYSIYLCHLNFFVLPTRQLFYIVDWLRHFQVNLNINYNLVMWWLSNVCVNFQILKLKWACNVPFSPKCSLHTSSIKLVQAG